MTQTENLPANISNETQVQFGFSQEKINLFRDTFCRGCSKEEMDLFLYVCSHTGLDPCTKQIYPVKRKSKQQDGTWKETMTIQTGIDGFRLIADRSKKYIPGKEPSFKYDSTGKIISATSYVKKQAGDGTWHEVGATAYFSEYVQRNSSGQPTKFWADMPHTMIAKCAEALALRKSFPAELSGIYTHGEMDQADSQIIDISQKAAMLQENKNTITLTPYQNDNHNNTNDLPIPTNSVFAPEKDIALNQEQIDTIASYLPKITNKCKSNFFDFFGVKNETELYKIPADKYKGTINSFNLNIESQKASA